MDTKPPRIVSLLAASTEMLFACGAGQRVVGVSHECNFPRQALALPKVSQTRIHSTAASGEIDRQVKSCVAAGQALYTIDVELLESLAPDLIVTQAQCDVCAIRYKDVLDAVARSDQLRDTTVVALNPQTLDDVLDDCLRVGRAAGCGAQADQFVAGLRSRIDAVRNRTVSLAESARTRVAVIEWIDPLMLAANWTPELVMLAGGQCSLAIAGRHSTYANWQQVIAFDPEVIVVAPCGFDLPRTIVDAEQLATFDHWRDISAVRSDRVFAVDGDAYFNRAGPRIVESLEILAHLAHPDTFATPTSAAHGAAWTKLDV